jgi:hypothetical protein
MRSIGAGARERGAPESPVFGAAENAPELWYAKADTKHALGLMRRVSEATQNPQKSDVNC